MIWLLCLVTCQPLCMCVFVYLCVYVCVHVCVHVGNCVCLWCGLVCFVTAGGSLLRQRVPVLHFLAFVFQTLKPVSESLSTGIDSQFDSSWKHGRKNEKVMKNGQQREANSEGSRAREAVGSSFEAMHQCWFCLQMCFFVCYKPKIIYNIQWCFLMDITYHSNNNSLWDQSNNRRL